MNHVCPVVTIETAFLTLMIAVLRMISVWSGSFNLECSQGTGLSPRLQGSFWHSHLTACLPGCSRVPAMCLAIAIKFQQVLLKATFILEVQIHLQQSIARCKAFQPCSEAAYRSTELSAASSNSLPLQPVD